MSSDTPPMDECTLAAWVARWRATGPVLKQLDRERAERLSLASAIDLLDDAFEAALLSHPPARFSGLVTQQRIFMGIST